MSDKLIERISELEKQVEFLLEDARTPTDRSNLSKMKTIRKEIDEAIDTAYAKFNFMAERIEYALNRFERLDALIERSENQHKKVKFALDIMNGNSKTLNEQQGRLIKGLVQVEKFLDKIERLVYQNNHK